MFLPSARFAPSLLLLELFELSVDSLLRFNDARRGRRHIKGAVLHDEVDIVADRLIRCRGVGGSYSKTESKLLS